MKITRVFALLLALAVPGFAQDAAKPENDALKAPADVAAPPADAEKSASGLASKVITKGSGTEKPGVADTVTVHYSGWKTDGSLFDSSVKRGKPSSFPLNGVIKGWTEGLQLLNEGGKATLFVPGDLGYGDNGRPGIEPGSMLIFEVELIEVNPAEE
jgi:FKBP-type peptidyl-prolyl cis-trans isomerase